MKYFDLTSVVNSYAGFQNSMTNKSWGYIALLKGCKSKIYPLKPYEVRLAEVSNFLDDVFTLSQTKKTYDTERSLYVIFSNKWEDYFRYQGKYAPNIFDVAVWAYRRKAFSDETTKEDIVSMFANEFNIPVEVISKGFNTQSKEILFTNSPYQESLLKIKLSEIGVNVSGDNIDAKKNSVVASPGEISRGPFIQTLYTGLDITDYVLILQSDYYSLYGNNSEKKNIKQTVNIDEEPLQQIFYGAPGTGKSHKIKEDERVKTADGKQLVFRTTFHPDSDYSTFVGAYKPTMKPVADRYKAVAGKDEEITYSFVAQTFLQAYVAAWNNIDENVFLVIEEINRGNCAQIFGDLFQLLDRDENGFSEYPIIADKDLKKYLNGKDEDGEDVLTNKKGIENGILCLPSNLHIWATMNTSDQSLFPIDSAFKRRWEWKYMPIANERKGWEIKIDVNKYDWWEFLEIINKKIEETTYSEDKKLGYFFCKAQNGVIDDKKFVGKVLFYLWNDVFKDTDLADSLFTDENGKKSFDKFYIPLGEGETKVDTARVIAFMEKLEIEPKSEGEIEEEELEEDGGVLYVIDGDTFKRKSYAGKEIMMQYLKKHPELTFQEIKGAFPDSMLGRITYGGVIAAEGADLGSYIRYYSPEQFTSSDGVNFRIFKQWTKVNMQNIIDFGNTHGIDVEVKER